MRATAVAKHATSAISRMQCLLIAIRDACAVRTSQQNTSAWQNFRQVTTQERSRTIALTPASVVIICMLQISRCKIIARTCAYREWTSKYGERTKVAVNHCHNRGNYLRSVNTPAFGKYPRSQFSMCIFLVLLAAAAVAAASPTLSLSAASTSVAMGRSVQLSLNCSSDVPVPVFPYVDGLQWGAFVTCSSAAPCSLPLPLPNAGTVSIVVAILAGVSSPPTPTFMVGSALPSNAVAVSNTLTVQVAARTITPPFSDANLQVGMEWEPWFTTVGAQACHRVASGCGAAPCLAVPWSPCHGRLALLAFPPSVCALPSLLSASSLTCLALPLSWQHNDDFAIGEAVPVLGWYDSFNRDVVKQHAIWLVEVRPRHDSVVVRRSR